MVHFLLELGVKRRTTDAEISRGKLVGDKIKIKELLFTENDDKRGDHKDQNKTPAQNRVPLILRERLAKNTAGFNAKNKNTPPKEACS